MTKTLTLIALTVLIASTSNGRHVYAQAPATQPARTAGNAAADSTAELLAEVRALRAELSEATRVSVRAQLLTARLQLQEQRLMHLDQQRSAVSAKRTEAERIRMMFATQLKQLEGDD